MVNENFCSDKKIGAIFGPFFWSKIWPFLLKNQFFGNFLRNRTSDLSKTWSETGTFALNHRVAVLCLGNFLFWPFWPFLGQKYIACGDIYIVLGCFWSFFSKPLMILGDSLLFELCLWFRNDE